MKPFLKFLIVTWFFFASISALGSNDCAKIFRDRLIGIYEYEPRISWNSQDLTGQPLASLPPDQLRARIEWIVDQVYLPGTSLANEVANATAKAVLEPDGYLSKLFFSNYEIIFFGSGYQQVIEKFDAFSPEAGQIADIGSGSAAFSASFAIRKKYRSITAVDVPHSSKVAYKRLEAIYPQNQAPYLTLEMPVAPLVPFELRTQDAAISNHFFYVNRPETQKYGLRELFKRLKPGSPFIVNEPIAESAMREGAHRRWFIERIYEGVLGGAKHTDFELAFYAGCVSGVAFRRTSLTPLEIPNEAFYEENFTRAGFRIKHQEKTYGGFSRLWVLEKP